MNSRTWIGTVLALSLGVALGWVGHGMSSARAGEAEEAGQEPEVAPDELAVPVATVPVEQRAFGIELTALGRARATPAARWQIASRAGGRIVGVGTRVGAKVARDQVLVRFDPAPLDLAMAEAKAAVDAAEAELRAFQGGGADIAHARLAAAVEQAQREMATAEREVERVESLVPDGLVSAKVVADARDTRDRRRVELRSAQAEADNFEASGRRAERDRLVAARAAAVAKYDATVAQRGEVEVRAPQDGIVIGFLAEPGRFFDPGAALGSLLVGDQRTIVFEFDDADAARVHEAASAHWTLDDGTQGSGTVIALSPVVDDATGLVEIEVEPAAGAAPLRDGTLIHGAIEVDRIADAMVVPVGALIRAEDALVVFRVGEDHCAHLLHVRVLARHGDSAAVTVDGDILNAGDRLVVAGGHNLPDGARVTEVEEKSGH